MAAIFFYLFAGLTLGSAALVVANRNTVNGALCLLLSLVGLAGLFVLLDAYLLAFVLLLVYAGAVVALFLFIIMLLDTQPAARKPFKPLTLAAAGLGGALLVMGVLSFLTRARLALAGPAETAVPSLKAYAERLFTTYLLPVQVVGFLLLGAMLGVVVLSKKLDSAEKAR
ncbi:MAG: NADH-quinone oxidoreductase subunit J [Opitutaceae bacterium]|nr:NADH-quinone oxidoreductase subunit J [Opitutaceae bacterium]